MVNELETSKSTAYEFIQWPDEQLVESWIESGQKLPSLTKIELRQQGGSGLFGVRITLDNGMSSLDTLNSTTIKEEKVGWRDLVSDLGPTKRLTKFAMKTEMHH